MKLRIGLIGLGGAWQSRHRAALRMQQDRFDVRAVFSTISKLAENGAAEFQADPMDGYRALVDRCDIDAVMILERSWLGWLPLLAACEAGKAVYWAGDFDFDPVRDRNVHQAIEESGVAFMAEFPRRFAPATLRMKELIATRLGPPRLVFCHCRMQVPSNGSKRTDECPRGDSFSPVEQELVELVDWTRYIVDRDPASMNCTMHHGQHSVDYQCLSLDFEAGQNSPPVTAQVSCGNYIPSAWAEAVNFRPPAAMQVCCERGVAFIDLPSTITWFDDAGRHLESLDTESPVGEQLLTQFHRSVTSLVRDLGSLNDVYHSTKILAAARKSVADGTRIQLS